MAFKSGAASIVSNSSITASGSCAAIQDTSAAPQFQSTTMTGNPGGNGIELNGGTIQSNNRWRAMGVPFVLTADVTVATGVTLTIDPGCVVKFYNNGCSMFAGLFVNGTLNAAGTIGAPITLTSFWDDAAGGDTNNDGAATAPGAGNWERVQFNSTSTGSQMSYCTVRYGGRASAGGCGTIAVAMVDVIGSSPQFDHCTFSNAYTTIMNAANSANVSVHYSCFSTAAKTPPCGVVCDASSQVDARNCFWGHSTGPYHATANPGGLGACVSDGVIFSPWWTSCLGEGARIVVNPAEVGFNDVLVGQEQTRTIWISNRATGGQLLTFWIDEAGPLEPTAGALANHRADAAVPDPLSPAATDVPWLTATPTSGIVAPGDSISVQIKVTASGLGWGIHRAFLMVHNNDSTSDPVIVPVWICEGSGCWVGVDPEPAVGAIVFGPGHPNPTRGVTSFDLALPEPGDVRLTVYDIAGRQVGESVVEALPAGLHQITWHSPDGRAGVFLARAQVNGRSIGQRRVVVIR